MCQVFLLVQYGRTYSRDGDCALWLPSLPESHRIHHRRSNNDLQEVRFGATNVCVRSRPAVGRYQQVDGSCVAFTRPAATDQSRRPHDDPRIGTAEGYRGWRQISGTAPPKEISSVSTSDKGSFIEIAIAKVRWSDSRSRHQLELRVSNLSDEV